MRALREHLGRPGALNELLHDGRSVAAERLDVVVIDELVSLGWARVLDDLVEPLVKTSAWQELQIAHDRDRPEQIEHETVLGVNNTTRSLASLTPRHHVARALDLATGPGGLALLLARHADVVIATDLSERACQFARANAELNDAAIEVRLGDLFGPVADEAPFDLISANLPFVVSPENVYTFRDGGRDRDEMSRDAVVGAAARLSRGGTAVLMCNWIVPHGEPAGEIPLGWISDPGRSVIVLHHSVQTPAEYASGWNKFILTRDSARYSDTVGRWITAFESWDIDGIANGTIIVHRPDDDGATFRQMFDMSHAPSRDGGRQISRIISNNGWLSQHGSEADLLAAVPVLVPPHRLEQSMRFDGAWQAGSAVVRLDDTAGVVGNVEPLATHVLLRVDGTTCLDTLIDNAAGATGLDRGDLMDATIRTMRELLATGCLALATPVT